LVAFRGTPNVNPVFGALSNVASGTTSAPAVTITNPGTVTDLKVAGVTGTSGTLAFTSVSDGTGQPASYYVRYAAGTISWASATELPPVAGGAIGTQQLITVPGLTVGTAYQFQVVAYRGTAPGAVVGGGSNVAGGGTTG